MGRVALLDTSVVLALMDAEDPHHRAAREALEDLSEHQLAISVITYAELMVGALRSGGRYPETAERFVADVPDVVEPASVEIAGEAARLRAAHPRLKLPDALIIATGGALDAERIVTADARWECARDRVELLESRPGAR